MGHRETATTNIPVQSNFFAFIGNLHRPAAKRRKSTSPRREGLVAQAAKRREKIAQRVSAGGLVLVYITATGGAAG